jgi:putative membrane protein
MIKKYFPHFLLALYIAEFAVLAFNPINRSVWWVENLTILPIVILLSILYIRGVRFSNISYLMMSILIFMHTIGGHYTFAHVPFDWFNNFFGFERNMYDRVAHATVGFYAYPIIESAIKYKWVNKKWFAYLAGFMIVPAFAAFYELFEWRYAISADPTAGLEVLGSQGDIWDAQKDMLMDTLGGLFGTVLYFIVNRKKD